MEITDDEIVSGIKKGDETALDLLIMQYGGLIKSIASKKLGDLYRDECVNDVLFICWKNISRFDPEKSTLKSWIAAICRYKCIDYRRKYFKLYFDELDENIPSGYSADISVMQKETEADTEALLADLPETDREIFRRRYIYEETIEEISDNMSIKPSVLYNRLSRGRKKLRDLLGRRSL
ncbi:MAG: sigma-70 family RNA polymerase sigma factor [Oscillospiraceae bacterium]|nr:sigma-70 family RNA polymerase sigma factor [Oscillospiraceae bacterium]